jgi:hypothetical protein
MARALSHLADLCGDARWLRFGEEDLAAAEPLRTTLGELKEAGLIKQVVMLGSSRPAVQAVSLYLGLIRAHTPLTLTRGRSLCRDSDDAAYAKWPRSKRAQLVGPDQRPLSVDAELALVP